MAITQEMKNALDIELMHLERQHLLDTELKRQVELEKLVQELMDEGEAA